jgi:biopolymer transport protein ExbD
MRTRQSKSPEVNSGSMADIAFLLLIFFLVTSTIPNDKGVNRKLPRNCPQAEVCDDKINERNLFRILLNAEDEILINDELANIADIQRMVAEFVDNNGRENCDYCHGKTLETSSDHPTEAVISIEAHSMSTYKQFIAVQDELTKAYFQLRKQYAQTVFNKYSDELSKAELLEVKKAYPFKISEAITKPIN